MSKIFTKKFLCYFCCIILVLTLMPATGAQNADSDDGIFYIVSAQSTHSFSAYMPHSLNNSQTSDRCVWFKNAEINFGTDPCKEFIDIQKIRLLSFSNKYSLPKSVFDNHLDYCQREVYHLLI